MLRLNRRSGDRIEIEHEGETLVLSVERIRSGEVSLGFDGPQTFDIWRAEIGETPLPEEDDDAVS